MPCKVNSGAHHTLEDGIEEQELLPFIYRQVLFSTGDSAGLLFKFSSLVGSCAGGPLGGLGLETKMGKPAIFGDQKQTQTGLDQPSWSRCSALLVCLDCLGYCFSNVERMLVEIQSMEMASDSA